MAAATQWGHVKELDTGKRSSASCHFEDALRLKIVGQEEAVQALADLYQVFWAGLQPPARPIGNLLLGRVTNRMQPLAELRAGANATTKRACAISPTIFAKEGSTKCSMN